MRALIWRTALIGILFITLIGSIIVLIQDQSVGSWLGLIGSIGSVMGAFVTTGLDITTSGAVARSPAAAPEMAPYVPPAPRRRWLNWLAIIQAATLGSILIGPPALFAQMPTLGLVCWCLKYLALAGVGVFYVMFARNSLEPGQRVPAGAAFAGSALASFFPAVVGGVANALSFELFPASQAVLDELVGPTSDPTLLGQIILNLFGVCVIGGIGVVVAGIAGLVTTAIVKER